jgi:hypothetical protein
VRKQIHRVHRRLLVQRFLDYLMWCWAGALGVSALWFILQPLVIGKEPEWLRLAVAGSALGVGTILAAVLTWLHSPSSVEAALELDTRFGLKERVTTSCMLSSVQAEGPAGQALINDVEHRVAALDVSSQFPVRLAWSTALLPTCAAVLALGTFFFQPEWFARNTAAAKNTNKVVNAQEIQDQLDKLKKVSLPKRELDLPKDDKLKELEAEWDKIVKKPLDPNDKEKVRERIQEVRDFQEKMKDRIQSLKDLADKNKDLKKNFEKLANIDPKGQKLDPPLKDLEDALQKGQMDKAIDLLDKLAKDLKANKLSPEEKKKLEAQLEELKNKLQRLADQKDLKDQLKKDFEDGKITKEELDREMDRLAQMAKEMADLQDLQELADLLGDCKSGLGEGH